ncbi:dCTP deaminase [Buchnera aphidicola (Formosaphis micheliae)]|uniref:dCTP deaminase n=1 Tax=Buchnera aphidicola TaxID=9 RepID=UPI0031CCB14E
MRLCDKDIEKLIDDNQLIIDPSIDRNLINGAAIDIHLGKEFCTFSDNYTQCVDLSKSREEVGVYLNKLMNKKIIIDEDKCFFLKPGCLVLGVTVENIEIPRNIVGWLDGRSSLARLGLMVHITSHRIDPGWKGNIVLEFFNISKLILGLKPGMLIASISFEILSGPALRPYNVRYNAKYFNQTGVEPSKINQD